MSCPEHRGSDPKGPPQRREALGRGPPPKWGVAPPVLGTLALPSGRPNTPPDRRGHRPLRLLECVARAGGCACRCIRTRSRRRGRQASPHRADRGAIVLRPCRPLIRPPRARRIARTGPAVVRSRGGQDERRLCPREEPSRASRRGQKRRARRPRPESDAPSVTRSPGTAEASAVLVRAHAQ
jgi:hypothetical protein